ncbi:MAG: hypothetical protein ACP5KN_08255, partial [Armatimonadota bacterium]
DAGFENTSVIGDDELDVAVQLIEAMTEEFTPEEFHNEYQDQVRELLEKKAEGEEYVVPEREKEEVEAESLVDALKRSLKEAKG